jgi:putative DNA primase/helicase
MTTEHVSAFIDAMTAAGMKPIDPIAGKLGPDRIRFRCEGDRKGKLNGWAVLHLDGRPAGAFGNWKLGISERWRADSAERLSREERIAMAAQFREEKRKRDAELLAVQEATASDCQRLWTEASAADPAHAYLVKKGIAGEGLRQSGNRLYVPMYDDTGKLWNIQRISPDGTKLFAKGGRQAGLHLVLGEPGAKILIAEGYATGASVRRATGYAAAIAFSWKGLTPVALMMRKCFPDAEIIVCADDDAHLVNHPKIGRNIGVEAAQDAARAVGGRVAMPPRKATA